MSSLQKEILLAISFLASVAYVTSSACHAKFAAIPGHSACSDPDDANRVVAGSSLTDVEETALLNAHNAKRAEVASNGAGGVSGATDMLKMVWDDELAMIAQKWADTCDLEHDVNELRAVPGRFKVGQNIYKGGVKPTMDYVVQYWYSEKSKFSYDTATAGVGHFTQVVWSQSNLLGCGISQCSGRAYEWAVICNYGVVGNMNGGGQSKFRPFTNGTTCSDCPTGKCDSDGLCDLGSKECHNGGTLNIPTESCTCHRGAWIKPANCDVDCSVTLAADNGICDDWVPAGYCDMMTVVKYQYCPNGCQLCPGADFNSFDKRELTEADERAERMDSLVAKLLMRILA